LERKQVRKRKAERQEGIRESKTKVKHISKFWGGNQIIFTTTSSLAKKTRDTIGANKTYSNEGSRENKCSYSKLTTKVDRVCTKIWLIYYGSRL